MKKICLIILVLFTSPIFSQTAEISITQDTEKKTIAVIPFTGNTGNSTYDGFRMQKDIEKALHSSQDLCDVADSDVVNELLREMNTTNTIEFGKAHGFDFVVYGTMFPFDYRHVTERHDPSDPEADVEVTITSIRVDFTIVDVTNGEIVYSDTISGEYSKDRTVIPLFGLTLTLPADADDDAYDNFVSHIEDEMENLFKLTASIEEIKENGDIILPLGTGYGVIKGQRFRVYEKDNDDEFRIGDTIKDSYKRIGTVRVQTSEYGYSIASVLRPFDIDDFDIIEEMNFVGLTFGFYSTFGSYKLSGYKETWDSETGEGKLTISVPKLDYSYAVHLGVGATIPIMPLLFTPTLSFGVLFGDLFETSWGVDTRINLEFQIPVHYEVISISIIPYLSFAYTFSKIGYVSGGDYHANDDGNPILIKNGTTIHSNDFFFGGGIVGTVRFNFTDTVGLSIGAGYKFYQNRNNLSTFAGDDGSDENTSDDVDADAIPTNLIDLTGLEVMLSIDFRF